MFKHRFFILVASSVTIAIFSFSITSPSMAYDAAALKWAWPEDECGTDDSRFDTYGDDWITVMSGHSWTVTNDATIFAQEIADDGQVAWGDDDNSNNIDANTAALVLTHGYCVQDDLSPANANGCWSDAYHNAYKLTTPLNNPLENCWTYSSDWFFGNDSANFIHSTACHSASYVVTYFRGRYEAMAPTLHQYGGIHGADYIPQGSHLDDFATEAFSSSMSSAWLNNMYCDACYTDPNDMCAISIVQGSTLATAQTRRDNERYNYQYVDPDGSYGVYHFVGDCDGPGVDTWESEDWYN